MSGPSTTLAEPIADRRDLIAHLASGSKPAAEWRIGTEHEKFVFDLSDLKRVPYDGPRGIRALLQGLTRFGWRPVTERGNVIALEGGPCSITLEPGGQLELSGAPLESIHETCDEVHTHLAQVKEVAGELGIGLIGLGFDPKWRREDVPWMPKGRYEIMRRYMPKKGNLGLDMMLRTCTVQVNLDYASEADMVKKFRTSLALQPIAVALFANSPFIEGKPNGYQSFRSHVWEDTDPDRCGILPFVFEDGMGFERYADYALDVPMYFVYRDGRYIDASGQSFRDFMAGKLPAFPGERPTLSDWADHLTTIFTEVRLKKYLEMRGADGGPWGRLCALPALWTGLLYDQTALDAAWDLCKGWSMEEHVALRRSVPREGFRARFRKGTIEDVAKEVLKIARAGLRARDRQSYAGADETGFLNILDETLTRNLSPAELRLKKFHEEWNGNIDPIFYEYAY
jgi:glutamate--cysteine ligase